MGDRANIAIKQNGSDDRVYLYGHWAGYELPAILQRALARKERWDDNPYLARIIFCTLVEGHEKDTTGFGISTTLQDNEHPIIVVAPDTQTVSFERDESRAWLKDRPLYARKFTFDEFIAIPDISWDVLDGVLAE